MLTAGTVILMLKIAVLAVTPLLFASLVALARGWYRWHGAINTLFAGLTLAALLGLEVIARVLEPSLFTDYFNRTGAWDALYLHLAFSLPSAVVLVLMLITGWLRLRAWHVPLGVIFLALWTGTFITGIFFLPHQL